MLKIIFIHTVRYVVPHLPHWFLMVLGNISGWLDSLGPKSKIIKNRLAILLGDTRTDQDIKSITRESLVNFHKDLFEIWTFPTLTKRKIEKITYFEGTKHLDEALRGGKGAIIGVTHFGSWKILIPALAHAGYDVMQIAVNPLSFITSDSGYINNKIMEIEYLCEQSIPVKFLYIDEYMRDMYRHLNNNGVLIMSFDGLERRREEKFTLGNMEIGLDTTPIRLSARTGVPLLPMFAIREQDNRHRLIIHKALHIDTNEPNEQVVKLSFAEYANHLKKYIANFPSHYARSLYVFATKWAEKI